MPSMAHAALAPSGRVAVEALVALMSNKKLYFLLDQKNALQDFNLESRNI